MPLINNKPVDIVDVGTGNIANICSAFKKINISYNLCSKVSDFNGGKIILPGVGAYADFMDKLNDQFKSLINERLHINDKKASYISFVRKVFSSKLDIDKGEFITKDEFVNYVYDLIYFSYIFCNIFRHIFLYCFRTEIIICLTIKFIIKKTSRINF